MAYVKPEVLAQNAAQGSFAAGCDSRDRFWCVQCEIRV